MFACVVSLAAIAITIKYACVPSGRLVLKASEMVVQVLLPINNITSHDSDLLALSLLFSFLLICKYKAHTVKDNLLGCSKRFS